MDPEAVDLPDYLGVVGRMGIDEIAARGKLLITGGIQKWTIGCNWKFAADNVWDYYHGGLTHGSAGLSGWNGRLGKATNTPVFRPGGNRFAGNHRSVLGEYGHALGGPQVTDEQLNEEAEILLDSSWRKRPDVEQALGPVGQRTGGHAGIFPNLWIMQGYNQVSLRLPKGPKTTEIWWFSFTYEDMDAQVQKAMVHRVIGHNGPAGMFEIDDGENWGESTRGMVGATTRHFPLNYAMNVGNGLVQQDESGPAYIDAGFNEHSQLWYYGSWAEWLAAESWADLKREHSKPEGTR
jgi:3-phenylpropionate/trans-cinnamate dioxygenase alpha subunit